MPNGYFLHLLAVTCPRHATIHQQFVVKPLKLYCLMTNKYFIVTSLVLITTLFISCKKDDINFESDFDKSFKEWINFKKTSDNSYKYEVAGGTWIGYGWITDITVTDGKVTERYFKLTPRPGSMVNIPADQQEWTEKETELNTHTQSPAAATITLDEIHDKARKEWLVKRDKVQVYFEAKNNGMISTCGYVNDGCQVDCFIGINISF